MRIALVEDERKLAGTLREGLEAEGYSVEAFFDGRSARDALADRDAAHDLIVLDLMLPHLDGLSVCTAIREAGALTPVLVLTARDATEDKVRALDAGADDFLTKPFAFDELLARVRALLRRSQQRPQATLAARGLHADVRERTASAGGTRLPLTPTELDLLILLMERAGEPVSREDISRHLWESSDASHTNIVDVHVSNLRKKIEHAYEKGIIETVRGLGYRIAR